MLWIKKKEVYEMFKAELHCHSCDVSQCARVDVDTIVDKYTRGGYSTLVLTNHFNSGTYDFVKAESWQDWVDKYMYGYTKLKERAGDKLEVLLGMEIRFNCNINDYLVFGITEELLRANENLFEMNAEKFSRFAKENGLLFIQAHPFRDNMTITSPYLLDGVEAFNGHKGHDSRNEIADEWADKYGLIKTSGTDFHYHDVPTNAGIMTDEKITSMPQLVEILKSGRYTLIKD